MGLNYFKEDKGAVLVIVAFAMVVLIGFTAFSIDVGGLFLLRRSLVTAADSAALAGAQVLAKKGSTHEEVRNETIRYAQLNGANLDTNNIKIIDTGGKRRVEVSVSQEYQHYFAGIFGLNSTEVPAQAVAAVGYPTGVKGNFLPIMLPKEAFDLAKNKGGNIEDHEVRLLNGDGEDNHFVHIDGTPVSGNWGVIRTGGTGSDVQRFYAAIRGESGSLELEISGDGWYEEGTKPGNFPQIDKAVEDRLSKDNVPNYGVVPIVTEVEKAGGQTGVKIVGFTFYEFRNPGTEKNPPGHDVIGNLKTGEVFNISSWSENSQYDYGIYVIGLVE
ncbi:MAG: hypothetical protein D5R97_09190 [Candidatus Syntrophonatronum acetioxidans]|uniref:Putative Flp pilus-assembly TadG-like N-terminal domain-containing protein n=1 Tax=Candidatus Syntrophonatronum acetioxidans TaxID=1795816 RepID=A0A424YAK9_9FIRM|nr:MAG: hypothetical protein D5R97_09190 [Candidatus Syntrophonatronum acetioxidans]